jgi:hypothetical protein
MDSGNEQSSLYIETEEENTGSVTPNLVADSAKKVFEGVVIC